jgi:hypothetical protein
MERMRAEGTRLLKVSPRWQRSSPLQEPKPVKPPAAAQFAREL